jgi:hypothetical protein
VIPIRPLTKSLSGHSNLFKLYVEDCGVDVLVQNISSRKRQKVENDQTTMKERIFVKILEGRGAIVKTQSVALKTINGV